MTNFLWEGSQTLAAVRAAMNERRDVELQLPADLHHSVFVHLKSAGDHSAAESVDVIGGSELLRRLARIDALAPLAELERSLGSAHAQVRVVSPSPKIFIHFGGAP